MIVWVTWAVCVVSCVVRAVFVLRTVEVPIIVLLAMEAAERFAVEAVELTSVAVAEAVELDVAAP